MSNKNQDSLFTIVGTTNNKNVPNWARRQPKWKPLMDQILALEPGKTLIVTFPTKSAADRARNTIRDRVNIELEKAVIRTRMIEKEDAAKDEDRYCVYFSKLHDYEVRESE